MDDHPELPLGKYPDLMRFINRVIDGEVTVDDDLNTAFQLLGSVMYGNADTDYDQNGNVVRVTFYTDDAPMFYGVITPDDTEAQS